MLHFRYILKLGILQVGLFLFISLFFVDKAKAQACDSITPSFTVNLTGKPDSVWTSTAVLREGHCCGATGSDKCISFWLTLDSNSNGIRLDIPSGALPGGALFYQIGCGTSYQVGQDICLTGQGPHHITFCKPGNNLNTYQIRAIPKPDLIGRLVINEACIGNLKVLGLDPTTINWQSVPNNTTYNGYLSCLTGCDSVSVTPSGAYPPTVKYRVCGTVSGGCGAAATFCDTATVRFVSNTDVDIQPKNPTVCFGGTNATITANPVGGLAPFKYLWSNGDTNQTIQVGVGTYHVQMLDSLGCTLVRDTVTVTSFASTIDANAGNDTTICRNAASVFLRGTTQGGVGGKWKGGLGTYAPNDTTLNAVYVPNSSEIFAGTVNLRLVTTRNGTCPADSDAVSITIKYPTATSINGPSNVCEFKTSIFSTNKTAGSIYLWFISGGIIQSTIADTMIQVLWGIAGNETITLRQINSFGCDSTVEKNVTINPTPKPIINGPINTCKNKVSVYTTSPLAGGTFVWTVTGGTIQSTVADTMINVLWGNATAGTVTLKVTNAFSCDSTVVKNIIINPTPTTIINGPINTCKNKVSVYTTSPLAGGTFVWTVTGGTIQSTVADTMINVLWGNGTAGTVTLKVTNAFLCDTTVIKNITINPNPDANISGNNNVCVYSTHVYQSNAVTATTHKWTVTGGSIIGSDTLSNLNVKWNTLGLGTLNYRGTNMELCDTVVTYMVTVNPKPVSNIKGNDSVCIHTTTWYYTPKHSTNTYQWQCSGGTILQQLDTAIFVRWHTLGVGWVSVKETNLFNCDSTATYQVRVLGKPQPGILGKLQLCQHESGEYFVPKQNNVTVVWYTNGFPQQLVNDTTIRVVWHTNGTYEVRAQVINDLGCDTSSNLQVTVHPKPYQNFNGGNVFCSYKTVTYNTIKRAGYTYEWTTLGGKIIGANNDTAVTVNWGDSVFASITLKSINPTGCDSSTTWIITLLKAPTGKISGDSVICSNVNPNHYSIPAQPNYSYFWTAQLGGFSSTNTSDQVDVNWQTPGFNNLRVRVYDNLTGCDSNFNKVVYVDSIVKPIIDMQPKNGCVPFTTQMLASNLTNLSYSYVWLSGDGKKYTSVNPIHTYLNAGVYPVQLKVTNANGCKDSTQTTVIANVQPKSLLSYTSPTTKIYVEDTVTFYNYSTNANAYLWKVNNQPHDSTFNWQHLFDLPGNYKIMLVAVDTLTGCIDSNYLRIDVRVHENIYVPNIFTPNNDGKNDFFSIGFENLAAFEVIIANRWGQIIYTSKDPNFSWDGTFGGKPCQDDAYVYIITATGVQGKTFSIAGNVTLLR